MNISEISIYFKKSGFILKAITASCVYLLFIVVISFADQENYTENIYSNYKHNAMQVNYNDTVDASKFGFNEKDSSNALQTAINSGAKNVIVPNTGKKWIIGPIKLVSNQKILFEPGVVLMAKKNSFKGIYDCLFSGDGIQNVTLVGYSADFKMRKDDYTMFSYKKSEHRHTLSLRGCKNIKITGIKFSDSGGDGIYVGRSLIDGSHSESISIKDCITNNNFRQGISITSVNNILIENCILKKTKGTSPQGGLLFEPNAGDILRGKCIVKNCVSDNNAGAGFRVQLKKLSKKEYVSIKFENCHVRNGNVGLQIGPIADNGPKGYIEFKNSIIENNRFSGIYIYDKSINGAHVKFQKCIIKQNGRKKYFTKSPIFLSLKNKKSTRQFGGIEFVDCYIHSQSDQAVLKIDIPIENIISTEIFGNIKVYYHKYIKNKNNNYINNTIVQIEPTNELIK